MGIQVGSIDVECRIAQVLQDIITFFQEVVLDSLIGRSQKSSNLSIVIAAGTALQFRIVFVPSRVEVKQLVVGHRHTTYGLRQFGTL